ncbi:Rieske (2Fe-2S) protein [Paenibacillus sp.]|jgi:nitrite reductase/ring-hydroxylating ferredoxin subunit|uniref:Rieske (2Fe-2S) protein n=1 Tax=Paenibacillus sp. TaxID=58172 RepID=UPI00282D9F87|nr:Rieske (2Fe-2S) protein [Paenibacillus sp.]MDR0268651.1 Rieske (2Fe-2S) protein [Paenibacillus sp.]
MRVKVAEPDAIKSGGKLIVKVKEMKIGLFRIEDEYYAWLNVCPHAAAPVCAGAIRGTRLPSEVYDYRFGMEDQVLRCPWHGWEFDLKSGHHLAAGSNAKLRGYLVESDETGVYIVLSERK